VWYRVDMPGLTEKKLRDIVREETKHLATKQELHAAIAPLAADVANLKVDVADLKKDMAEVKENVGTILTKVDAVLVAFTKEEAERKTSDRQLERRVERLETTVFKHGVPQP